MLLLDSCQTIATLERPGKPLAAPGGSRPQADPRGSQYRIPADSKGAVEATPAPQARPVQSLPADIREVSDDILVARCKTEIPHNLDPYDELVRRYRSLVFNTCNRMIGDRLDAEEVCQDVFLRVFHKIYQFEGRSSFKSWLFRIVHNMCLSRRGSLATRRNREAQFADELTVQISADLTDAGTDDLADSILKALNRLDDEKRRIVALKFISGLKIEEIADLLDLKLSAAKMRLYRARDELRTAYFAVTGSELAA